MTSPKNNDTQIIKPKRGRPRKYDNWFEFNYEYHKMMDNERKKQPDVHARKMEYQRKYRKQKKEERMLATMSPHIPLQIACKIYWRRWCLLAKMFYSWMLGSSADEMLKTI